MAYYPGQKVQPSNPRRITLSKVLVIVAVITVTYVAITLVPPYWRYYSAATVMTEQSEKAYNRRRPGHTWEQTRSQIHSAVRTELLETLRIPADDLHLEVEKRQGNIYVRASWKTVARWPLVNKTTTLNFTEQVDFRER